MCNQHRAADLDYRHLEVVAAMRRAKAFVRGIAVSPGRKDNPGVHRNSRDAEAIQAEVAPGERADPYAACRLIAATSRATLALIGRPRR